jgi:hypothetical protein
MACRRQENLITRSTTACVTLDPDGACGALTPGSVVMRQ